MKRLLFVSLLGQLADLLLVRRERMLPDLRVEHLVVTERAVDERLVAAGEAADPGVLDFGRHRLGQLLALFFAPVQLPTDRVTPSGARITRS